MLHAIYELNSKEIDDFCLELSSRYFCRPLYTEDLEYISRDRDEIAAKAKELEQEMFALEERAQQLREKVGNLRKVADVCTRILHLDLPEARQPEFDENGIPRTEPLRL